MTWKRGWPTTFQEDGCAENSRRKMEQTQFSRSEIIPVDNSYSTQLTHLKRRQLCPLLAKYQHCGAFLNTTRNPGMSASLVPTLTFEFPR